jgi:hypothetical protein
LAHGQPGIDLNGKRPYYIEPVEQTPEVQLDALIAAIIAEDDPQMNTDGHR